MSDRYVVWALGALFSLTTLGGSAWMTSMRNEVMELRRELKAENEARLTLDRRTARIEEALEWLKRQQGEANQHLQRANDQLLALRELLNDRYGRQLSGGGRSER